MFYNVLIALVSDVIWIKCWKPPTHILIHKMGVWNAPKYPWKIMMPHLKIFNCFYHRFPSSPFSHHLTKNKKRDLWWKTKMDTSAEPLFLFFKNKILLMGETDRKGERKGKFSLVIFFVNEKSICKNHFSEQRTQPVEKL